jgi:light-regulated signal transduction histidine kinase (bacteriophytochrome)
MIQTSNVFSPREIIETECDRYNFETPGKIQSHGALLLLQEPSLVIVQLSQNALKIVGVDHKLMINQPILNFLTEVSKNTLTKALKSTDLSMVNPIRLDFNGKVGDAILLRKEGFLYIEIEPVGEVEDNNEAYQIAAMQAMEKFQNAVFPEQLIELVTNEIREITNFDRVMFYKFDEDYNGKVIAEATVRGVDSFLNLHFPASDIPKRVRDLYLTTKSRYLPDLHEPQVPLFPELNPVTKKPTQMGMTILRAVAPTHIEYMHNLGINSSLSFNIIKDGKFYGMIACHHYSGKFVPYVNRLVCEQMVEMFVMMLSQLDNESLHLAQLKPFKESALNTLRRNIKEAKTDLLAMVNADGAAVYIKNELHTFGYTPTQEQILSLISLLSDSAYNILYEKDSAGIFVTNKLSAYLNGAEKIKHAASGLIAVPISKTGNDFILWFRPEQIITAAWAGNPDQALHIDEKTMRVSPRKSFAAWKKNVEGSSLSWEAPEVQMAIELRDALLNNNL